MQDLAKHFAEGRLSAAQLASWTEDEIEERLIAVRGIGKVLANILSSADFVVAD